MRFIMDLNLDAVIAGRQAPCWTVCDRILVANIASNFGCDRIDIVEGGWKESDATGLAGELLQVMFGVAGLIAAKEEADGVDDWALHILNAMNRVFERELRGIVVPIGDDNQHLSRTRRGDLHLAGSDGDGVIQCRSSGLA